MAYSKNEQKSIRYGYLWHWGSIGCILLIPFLAVAIAKSCEAVSEIQEFLFLFSMGICGFLAASIKSQAQRFHSNTFLFHCRSQNVVSPVNVKIPTQEKLGPSLKKEQAFQSA